jgi:hypothetical protein
MKERMNIVTIDPARLAKLEDPGVHLISGSGSGINGKVDGCVMNFANFLAGGDGASDSHPCVDATICRFCIRLNDAAAYKAFRDELKPYAAKVLNTAGGADLSMKRAYLCADWAVRTIAPLAIDANGKRPDLAERFRSVAPIVDKATSLAARDITRKATKELRAADAAAADAADAASDAAAYAYAAAYAAYAAAYASAAASAAADAASASAAADAASAYAADADAASKSADFTRRMWDSSLELLDRLIAA